MTAYLLVLLVCSSSPTMGYDGCARWSLPVPDERACHHAGRRWTRTGQAEAYECRKLVARMERDA